MPRHAWRTLGMGGELTIRPASIARSGDATARAGVPPVWAGLALVIEVVASIAAAEAGGTVLLGLAWIAIGYAILLAGDRREGPTSGTASSPRSFADTP